MIEKGKAIIELAIQLIPTLLMQKIQLGVKAVEIVVGLISSIAAKFAAPTGDMKDVHMEPEEEGLMCMMMNAVSDMMGGYGGGCSSKGGYSSGNANNNNNNNNNNNQGSFNQDPMAPATGVDPLGTYFPTPNTNNNDPLGTYFPTPNKNNNDPLGTYFPSVNNNNNDFPTFRQKQPPMNLVITSNNGRQPNMMTMNIPASFLITPLPDAMNYYANQHKQQMQKQQLITLTPQQLQNIIENSQRMTSSMSQPTTKTTETTTTTTTEAPPSGIIGFISNMMNNLASPSTTTATTTTTTPRPTQHFQQPFQQPFPQPIPYPQFNQPNPQDQIQQINLLSLNRFLENQQQFQQQQQQFPFPLDHNINGLESLTAQQRQQLIDFIANRLKEAGEEDMTTSSTAPPLTFLTTNGAPVLQNGGQAFTPPGGNKDESLGPVSINGVRGYQVHFPLPNHEQKGVTLFFPISQSGAGPDPNNFFVTNNPSAPLVIGPEGKIMRLKAQPQKTLVQNVTSSTTAKPEARKQKQPPAQAVVTLSPTPANAIGHSPQQVIHDEGFPTVTSVPFQEPFPGEEPLFLPPPLPPTLDHPDGNLFLPLEDVVSSFIPFPSNEWNALDYINPSENIAGAKASPVKQTQKSTLTQPKNTTETVTQATTEPPKLEQSSSTVIPVENSSLHDFMPLPPEYFSDDWRTYSNISITTPEPILMMESSSTSTMSVPPPSTNEISAEVDHENENGVRVESDEAENSAANNSIPVPAASSEETTVVYSSSEEESPYHGRRSPSGKSLRRVIKRKRIVKRMISEEGQRFTV